MSSQSLERMILADAVRCSWVKKRLPGIQVRETGDGREPVSRAEGKDVAEIAESRCAVRLVAYAGDGSVKIPFLCSPPIKNRLIRTENHEKHLAVGGGEVEIAAGIGIDNSKALK